MIPRPPKQRFPISSAVVEELRRQAEPEKEVDRILALLDAKREAVKTLRNFLGATAAADSDARARLAKAKDDAVSTLRSWL